MRNHFTACKNFPIIDFPEGFRGLHIAGLTVQTPVLSRPKANTITAEAGYTMPPLDHLNRPGITKAIGMYNQLARNNWLQLLQLTLRVE